MAQITIEIPDDIAQKLAPYQSQFSELFARLIAPSLLGQSLSEQGVSASNQLITSITHQDVLDFLISQPTSQQILDFKVSEQSQNRLQTLLKKSREVGLTPAESTELDLYEQLDTLIGLLKIRAHRSLGIVHQG